MSLKESVFFVVHFSLLIRNKILTVNDGLFTNKDTQTLFLKIAEMAVEFV
jgi:hypothetical protein